MASFAAQAAIRSKWTSLVEEHTIEVPAEVSSKVTSVVGWLKQVYFSIITHNSVQYHVLFDITLTYKYYSP